MDTPRHRAQMELLIGTLEDAWDERRDFYVGGNMFVYFSELQSRQNASSREWGRGPDFFVVLDTDRHKVRKSWVAWQEDGKLPDVVVELLSERTADVDRGEKKRIYERVWRTAYYVMYDVETQELEGLALVDGRYVPITPDARGDLPIGNLGLALGIRPAHWHDADGDWLRWIDASGQPLPHANERAANAIAQRDEAVRLCDEAVRLRDEVVRERDEAVRERDALARRIAELERAGR